ncbi:MAG TPA: hypothetical protein VKZ50_04540 [bacterium]|nr:hypothetical protein [bacterium]
MGANVNNRSFQISSVILFVGFILTALRNWDTGWIIAAATLVLAVIAYTQLRGLQNTATGDFVFRFNEAFYFSDKDKKQNQQLIEALDKTPPDAIFAQDAIGHTSPHDRAFWDAVTAFRRKEHAEGDGKFDAYHVDSYLGYLDALGTYWQEGMLDFDVISDVFGHYALIAFRNGEITAYVDWCRAEYQNTEYYRPAQDFYDEDKRVSEKHKPS